jgi:U4/U6.U5 tri-snRNP component SNU23
VILEDADDHHMNDDKDKKGIGRAASKALPEYVDLTNEGLKGSTELLDKLHKPQLVAAALATKTRGKGVGFYCEACNETFKDNLSYIGHLSLQQHLRNVKLDEGERESEEEEEITLADVTARLLMLKELKWAKESRKEGKYDVEMKIKQEEDERLVKRRKRKEKKQQAKQTTTEEEPDHVAAMMGFNGFGSSKT